MALPHLIKYVYTNGTDEVIRRGKKIHAIGYVELVDYDELLDSVSFRVKDDSYSTFYRVNIQKFKDPKTLSVRCTCPRSEERRVGKQHSVRWRARRGTERR